MNNINIYIISRGLDKIGELVIRLHSYGSSARLSVRQDLDLVVLTLNGMACIVFV
jgi:hypothetical protein